MIKKKDDSFPPTPRPQIIAMLLDIHIKRNEVNVVRRKYVETIALNVEVLFLSHFDPLLFNYR